MEIKELMIGDWVSYSREPFQVDYCHRITDTIGLKYKGESPNFHDGVICAEDAIPVPLTPEILEKNGWWYDIEDMWQHDEVNFCIEKWNGRFQCYDINQIKLYSVHQLQHALRLCGLNELADNFKV